jgi:hypothetical protein
VSKLFRKYGRGLPLERTHEEAPGESTSVHAELACFGAAFEMRLVGLGDFGLGDLGDCCIDSLGDRSDCCVFRPRMLLVGFTTSELSEGLVDRSECCRLGMRLVGFITFVSLTGNSGFETVRIKPEGLTVLDGGLCGLGNIGDCCIEPIDARGDWCMFRLWTLLICLTSFGSLAGRSGLEKVRIKPVETPFSAPGLFSECHRSGHIRSCSE